MYVWSTTGTVVKSLILLIPQKRVVLTFRIFPKRIL
jgi:hypothetical protein